MNFSALFLCVLKENGASLASLIYPLIHYKRYSKVCIFNNKLQQLKKEEVEEKQRNSEVDAPHPDPSRPRLSESFSLKSSGNSQVTQKYTVFPAPVNYAFEWSKLKKSVPYTKRVDRVEEIFGKSDYIIAINL